MNNNRRASLNKAIKLIMIRIAEPSHSDIRIPVFLIREKMEKLISNSSLKIEYWEGKPLKNWFKYEDYQIHSKPVSMILSDCGVTDDLKMLCFDNGRHRTRWLLQSEIEHIPVYLNSEKYNLALKAKIIYRKANYNEIIPDLTVNDALSL